MVENCKKTAINNLTNLIRAGHLKIDQRYVPGLMVMLSSSIEEGFHTNTADFMKTVDAMLADVSMPALSKKNRVFGR